MKRTLGHGTTAETRRKCHLSPTQRGPGTVGHPDFSLLHTCPGMARKAPRVFIWGITNKRSRVGKICECGICK